MIAAAADRAQEAFVARFQKGAMPENMREVALDAPNGGLGLAQALKSADLTKSTSEALRMIGQGAVRIDGERVTDKALEIPAGTSAVFQVGKRRFARITVV